ncbi:MAG: hypothetical protein NVS4B12_18950 [Ktedonobacteraceae bacterium]
MLQAGQQFGQYSILEKIGSGGMGDVYLAEERLSHRQVALKVLRSDVNSYPNVQSNQEAMRLFEREIQLATQFEHPGILEIFTTGEQITEGSPVLYMAFATVLMVLLMTG